MPDTNKLGQKKIGEKVETMVLSEFKVLVAVTATIVGGIWAFYLFWAERHHEPKLEIKVEVSCYPFDSKSKLITAKLDIYNIGKVAIKPTIGQIKLQQVVFVTEKNEKELKEFNGLKSDADSLLWPQIGNREWVWNSENEMLLEPSESDQLEADFIVLNKVELLRVYGYINNPAKPKIGWGINHTFSTSEKCKQKN